MPKLIRSIPAYQKHRASGQAVVSLNGRDFYLGPHGTKASKLEYDRLISEWLKQGRQLQPEAEADGLSVVELLAAYLHFARDYYRRGHETTSEIHAIRSAMRPVKLLYGRKPCAEFGPIALQVVMQRMADDNFARSTINQHASRIKRIFKWGVSQELIPAACQRGRGEQPARHTSVHSRAATFGKVSTAALERRPKSRHTIRYERLLQALRMARKEAGLTQMEVAKHFHAYDSFVSKIESGERRIDVVELADFCRLYNIRFSVFLKRAGLE